MAETLVNDIESEWIFDILFLPIIAIITAFTGES